MLCGNCECGISSTGSPPLFKNDDLSGVVNLPDIEAELGLLEKMFIHLEERRRLLNRKMNDLAPVARLPEELLVEIFKKIDCVPFYLGSICQRWRSVVWSTPLMWSVVPITVNGNFGPAKCELLAQWLSHADETLLNIKMRVLNGGNDALYGVTAVLAARAAYWGQIDCAIPAHAYQLLEDCTFPLLTSATLQTQATVPDLIHILRRAPNLARLHVHEINFGDPDVFDRSLGTTTRHDKLTSLELPLLPKSAAPVLDSLELPSLRRLVIKTNSYQSFIPRITRFITRSGCQLRTLEIEERSGPVLGDVVACVQVTPSLEELSLRLGDSININLPGLWGEQLVRLMNPSFGEPLVPSLVSFEYCGPRLCDGAHLLDMIRARSALKDIGPRSAHPVQTIQRVQVTSGLTAYTVTEQELEWITSLAPSYLAITLGFISISGRQAQPDIPIMIIRNVLEPRDA